MLKHFKKQPKITPLKSISLILFLAIYGLGLSFLINTIEAQGACLSSSTLNCSGSELTDLTLTNLGVTNGAGINSLTVTNSYLREVQLTKQHTDGQWYGAGKIAMHSDGTISESDLSFYVKDNNAWSENLRLKSSWGNSVSALVTLIAESTLQAKDQAYFSKDVLVTGKVGIGVVDPAYSLDIYGNMRTTDRYYSKEWIQFDNHTGLYSPLNGAHFYPNDGSYGSWRVAGSRNSWYGLEFDTAAGQTSLMMGTTGQAWNSQTIGVHNNSQGWIYYFEGGNLWTNSYGWAHDYFRRFNTWQNNHYSGTDGIEYATAFYDSNDGGFYVNPDGSSKLRTAMIGYKNYDDGSTPTLKVVTTESTNNQFAVQRYFPGSGTYSTDLIVTNAGKVGIGGVPSTPYILDVHGQTRFDVGSFDVIVDYAGGEPTVRSSAANYGYLGTSAYYWYKTYSNYMYSNSYGTLSDIKIKKNIKPLDNALDKIMALDGISYNLKEDYFNPEGSKENTDDLNRTFLGFIAQDVEKILPDVVSYDEESDLKLIDYQNIIPVITEAMKEQQEQIEQLKAIVCLDHPEDKICNGEQLLTK
ncbi:MAG: tail fiber domain-containing protein [Patescibacteria group bacterium]